MTRIVLLLLLLPSLVHAQAGVADVDAQLAELRRQQTELLEQVVAMNERIERLVRVVREGDMPSQGLEDLAPFITALDSDSYRERLDATATLRRALVDRLWVLLDMPDLTGEARHRLKTLLVETTAMIRLTAVAADLQPSDRDALWNLLDAEPGWVLAALGDDPHGIREALRQPPPKHGPAAEIVLAALLRDELRPAPQQIALQQIDEATSPLLRATLKNLISPAYQPRTGSMSLLWNQRERAAEEAVGILARTPSDELIAFFLAYLQTTETWSAKVEFRIVDALVAMRARDTASKLVEIGVDKRQRLHGGQSVNGLLVKPGDCEIIGAALLLGIDLGELSIRQRPARNADDPPFYGFDAPRPPEHEERNAAYSAVERAVGEGGPYAPIPGLDEALRALRSRR